jgi:hypothetical protein
MEVEIPSATPEAVKDVIAKIVAAHVDPLRAFTLSVRVTDGGTAIVTAGDSAFRLLPPIEDRAMHPLLRLRTRAGMSLVGFSAYVGLSVRQLHRIEAGSCVPQTKNVDRIMAALGLTAADPDIDALHEIRRKKFKGWR